MKCPICKNEMIIEDLEENINKDFVNITYICKKCSHKSIRRRKE